MMILILILSIVMTLAPIIALQSVIRLADQKLLHRLKRQLTPGAQKFFVRNAVLNVPIPVNVDFYPGGDEKNDKCPRDEVALAYENKCQNLLQQGSCKKDEVVLIDPDNNMGYCAPRLCPPDRVFVHSTQLCHDPQDTATCPLGRELYYSAYGTAVCDCPEGTVESSNKIYGDVCEPYLSESHLCPKGQVIGFADIDSKASCVPDPCYGQNLYRDPNTLPFVPSKETGKCFQLGQTNGVCPQGLVYALNLPTLKGVCETLENLGYEQFNSDQLEFLNIMYGVTDVKNNAISISDPIGHNEIIPQPHQLNNREQIINSYENNALSVDAFEILRSLGFRNAPVPGILVAHVTTLASGDTIVHVKPYDRKTRNASNGLDEYILYITGKNSSLDASELDNEILTRNKRQQGGARQLYSHASPTNTFETRFLKCSPRYKRDLNRKCQENVLPASKTKSKGTPRPPIPPSPGCPQGQAISIRRRCEPRNTVQSKLNTRSLG